jgi:glycosyltransferase involved in cell wall biosynthesis
MGHESIVAMPVDGPLTRRLETAGADVAITPLHAFRLVSGWRGIRLPVRLPDVCAGADIVVIWTLAMAAYLPALRWRRRAALCSVHEILPGARGRMLADATLLLCGKTMVNSHATSHWLTRHYPWRRPTVAYPIAPPYEPLPGRSADGRLRLLLAGRVNGHKGHIEAIRATRQARRAGTDVSLCLLGGAYPGQEHHLQAMIQEADAEPWISYEGEVPTIRPYLAANDVLLIPTTRPEPFGVVALEAWAAGRRVIASKAGGLAEAAAMVDGIMVPAGDVDALAQAIMRVAESPALRGDPGASVRASRVCTAKSREDAWRHLLER